MDVLCALSNVAISGVWTSASRRLAQSHWIDCFVIVWWVIVWWVIVWWVGWLGTDHNSSCIDVQSSDNDWYVTRPDRSYTSPSTYTHTHCCLLVCWWIVTQLVAFILSAVFHCLDVSSLVLLPTFLSHSIWFDMFNIVTWSHILSGGDVHRHTDIHCAFKFVLFDYLSEWVKFDLMELTHQETLPYVFK